MGSETIYCPNCQLLFFDQSRIIRDDTGGNLPFIPLKYQFEDEFPSLPNLTLSADSGCLMCDFIKNTIWRHYMPDPIPAELVEREGQKPRVRPEETPKKVRLVLSEYHLRAGRWFRDASKANPFYIHGQIYLDNEASTIRIDVTDSHRDFPEVSILTEKSPRMIQDWLSDCADQHEDCPGARENLAPKRLLDVTEGDTVRLVETEGLVLKYAILSYCWGSSAAMIAARSLKSNISERMVGFPLSCLPQTLQDGITVARSLEIQYIWIDSICIVQDSDEWSTEAPRMMSYYENSYVTIIPVICNSADQGFLGPRGRWVSKWLTGTWVGQPDRGLLFHYPRWEGVDHEAASSTWGSRGWTFQERLLSARILYFGRHGIGFECRGASHREVNRHTSKQLNVTSFLPNNHSSELGNVERIRSLWYQIVSQYVERQLTYESDRLIALSGVAQKFEILLGGDEYISGFWKSDLFHGLCWRFWRGWSTKRQWSLTKSPSFPSWSWCSMKRPVTWADGAGSIPCAVLVERVKCGSQDVKLLLTAWIFSASLLKFDAPEGLEFETRLDADEEPTEAFKTTSNYMAVVMSVYLDDEDEVEWRSSPTGMLHEVYGLIVEKAGTSHGNLEEYRRIGTFDVFRDMGIEPTVRNKSLGETFYKQVYALRCTISLI